MLGMEFIFEEIDITRKEVAEMMGVTPQSFNGWIKGSRKMPKERLDQLSTIVGVSTDMLAKEVDIEDKIVINKTLNVAEPEESSSILDIADYIDVDLVKKLYKWKDVIEEFEKHEIESDIAFKVVKLINEMKKI